MRDFTPAELTTFFDRQTPLCGHSLDEQLVTAKGGVCVNIECAACKMKTNVASPGHGIRFGQVLYSPPSYSPLKQEFAPKTARVTRYFKRTR